MTNTIYLNNTLHKKKEVFKPIIAGKMSMYNCGPTVYDAPHIGNFRSYIMADTIKRTFLWNGYEVKQIINITDIGHLSSDADDGDDKMTKALIREGLELSLVNMKEIALKYYDIFRKNLEDLNILPANSYPFASDHIYDEAKMVHDLLEKGFAYKTSDGIYFDTGKKSDYGKLGQTASTNESDNNARVNSNPEKRNFRDFALWKFSTEKLGFDSMVGIGFPGWHIECSAMSDKYLGQTFDIHTGGIDHIPVHHNNEIAQSEATHDGAPLANYWVHNAFMVIDGDKMSKSTGSFTTLQSLVDEGLPAISLRYWFLQAKYSSQVNFTLDTLRASNVAYQKLIEHVHGLKSEIADFVEILPRNEELFTYEEIMRAIDKANIAEIAQIHKVVKDLTGFANDDMDTARIIGEVWTQLKGDNLSRQEKAIMIIVADSILGLKLISNSQKYTESGMGNNVVTDVTSLPQNIQDLIEQRKTARQNKDWGLSDKIRDELKSSGYTIKDLPNDEFELIISK